MSKRIRKSQQPWAIHVSYGLTAEGQPTQAEVYASAAAFADQILERANIQPRSQVWRNDAERYNALKNSGTWLCHGTDAGDRQKDSFGLVDFLQLDIDKAPAGSFKAVLDGLRFAHVAYPSTGHQLPVKDGLDCFRVIVPLTAPVNAGALLALTAWLGEQVAALGGFPFSCVDRASGDINRIMYLPWRGAGVVAREGAAVTPTAADGYTSPWEETDSGLAAGTDTNWTGFDELVSILLSVDGASMTKRGHINMPSQSGRDFSGGRNANDAWQFRGPSGEFTEIVLKSQHEQTESGMKAREAFTYIDGATAAYEAGLKGRRPTALVNFAGKVRAAGEDAHAPAADDSYVPVLDEDGYLSREYDLEATDEEGYPDPWFRDSRDKNRVKYQEAHPALPLCFVPPDGVLRKDKDGRPTAFTASNTDDNLRWVLDLMQWRVVRNVMTWEVELYDWDGRQLTSDEATTSSMIISAMSRRGVPKEAFKDHFDALANLNSYHPVSRLLSFGEWDGVPRVDRVLACINAERPAFAHTVLRATLNAAIAALDDGRVQMKSCPVLFSKANDWHKTQFVQRMFDILPGAFTEGLNVVKPDNKDSVRTVVSCWGGEFGELGTMGKVDTEQLKAWLPKSSDKWRQEHKSVFFTKPRQSVYVGTINQDDFIKDETIRSRFPVLALAGPVHIDEMNEILGWEYDGSIAKLAEPEKLRQFWLEVRATRGSYIIPAEAMAEAREVSERFEDKGSYYVSLQEHIAMTREAGRPDGWWTSSSVCEMFGVPVQQNVHIGRALKRLARERFIENKMSNGVSMYCFPGKVV